MNKNTNQDNFEWDFIQKYLLLFKSNDSFMFTGLLELSSLTYIHVTLTAQNYETCHEATIAFKHEQIKSLNINSEQLQNVVECAQTKPNQTLSEYVDEIVNFLKSHQASFEVKSIQNMRVVEYLAQKIPEIRTLEGLVKVRINKRLDSVRVVVRDESERVHDMHVGVTVEKVGDCAEEMIVFKLSRYNLPTLKNVDLTESTTDLAKIIVAFVNVCNNLAEYFDELDNIDSVCWVLDSCDATYASNVRRINLGNDISLQLTINPQNPRLRPKMRFLGKEKSASAFRALSENEWDCDMDVVSNIKKLLDLPFLPIKPSDEQVDEDGNECPICFSLYRDGCLIDIACTGKCQRMYHTRCLYQWLSNIATKKIIDKRMLGSCLICYGSILCPIPTS